MIILNKKFLPLLGFVMTGLGATSEDRAPSSFFLPVLGFVTSFLPNFDQSTTEENVFPVMFGYSDNSIGMFSRVVKEQYNDFLQLFDKDGNQIGERVLLLPDITLYVRNRGKYLQVLFDEEQKAPADITGKTIRVIPCEIRFGLNRFYVAHLSFCGLDSNTIKLILGTEIKISKIGDDDNIVLSKERSARLIEHILMISGPNSVRATIGIAINSELAERMVLTVEDFIPGVSTYVLLDDQVAIEPTNAGLYPIF